MIGDGVAAAADSIRQHAGKPAAADDRNETLAIEESYNVFQADWKLMRGDDESSESRTPTSRWSSLF